MVVTVHGPYTSRAPQSQPKTSSLRFQAYYPTSKSRGVPKLHLAALQLQLPSDFPSLGFPLPRATSTVIPRLQRFRVPPCRAEPGRTRRPGSRRAGAAPPHAQPGPPLATHNPYRLPLPFPLTAKQEGGRRKPLLSGPAHRRGGAGRDEEVAGRLPGTPLLEPEREGGAAR